MSFDRDRAQGSALPPLQDVDVDIADGLAATYVDYADPQDDVISQGHSTSQDHAPSQQHATAQNPESRGLGSIGSKDVPSENGTENESLRHGTGTRAPSIRPHAAFFAPKRLSQQQRTPRPSERLQRTPKASEQQRRTSRPSDAKHERSLSTDMATHRSSPVPRKSPRTGLMSLSTMGRAAQEHNWPSQQGSIQSHPIDSEHARTLSTSTRAEKLSLRTRASNDPLLLSSRQSSLKKKQQLEAGDDLQALEEKGSTHIDTATRLSAVQKNRRGPSASGGIIKQSSRREKDTSRRRRYQAHRGGNRFYLGGRIMTSDDNLLAFLASLTVMIALPVLWLIFDAPYVWRMISPAPVILFAYLFAMALSSMLVTSLRDPGILPRDLDPDPPCTAGEGTGYVPSTDPLAIPVPRVIRVRHGTDLKIKWCETCETYRPPRSSHCRVCDNCVENIDHHCTFLNTCIGRRNYVTFIAFLITAILTSFFATAFSALHLYYLTRSKTSENDGKSRTFQDALSKSPMSAVLFFLSIGAAGPLVTLLSYHVRLVGMNRTTVEQIRINATKLYSEKPEYDDRLDANSDLPDKENGADCSHALRAKLCCCCGCGVLGQPGRDPNPFAHRTVWRNVRAALCRPMTAESWVGARQYVVDDDRQANPGTA